MSRNNLLNELWKELDTFDRWGWCMSSFFAVAGEMWSRGLEIPYEWKYSPGMAGDGRDPESPEFEYCEQATDAELNQAGTILRRYSQMLTHARRDY